MGLNTEELKWIAMATAVAAVLLVGGARFAAAIRLRRHRDLIGDALERMCALLSEPATRPRLQGLAHDVVEVLARQDTAASALRAKDSPAAESREGLALLVAADALTTTIEPIHAGRPDDSVWEEAAVAPSVGEHPQLKEIIEQMGRSSTRQVAIGRMVLSEGDRFGLPEAGAKELLAAAFDRARLAVRDAERLAEDKGPLVALAALTAITIPVPESGFPGQAVADELRTQVNTLARLGIRHHTALSQYRAAESRKERR
ncbi:hypothetical protein DMC64_14910 [Amycolatopsis sp. WAC 04197]|uniref:hypothetical protein n=1 Tax=Amycolatopsis sp. WAC 04197 TaxID=2203199 RepID=UPI000F773FDE|nr:hypothetical protein [Amycolatopsis sp. WAC 04197]RSN46030.1 hypothetical protein DMC64_14910 [Amycolatopsis sp. WAC 04197]